MAFSSFELKHIDKTAGQLCRRRSPVQHRHQVRIEYRVKGHDVLIYSTQPSYRDSSRWTEHGVAKLRYVRSTGEWRLFWLRATLKWQAYDPLPSSRAVTALVAEIDSDPHGCFFG